MTRYTITENAEAGEITGLPWVVSCFVGDSLIWQQHVATRFEAVLLTQEG